MATHLIIGKGNLGLDLSAALLKQGNRVYIVSKTTGFNYPFDNVESLLLYEPNYIWIAAGAGSVEAVKTSIVPSIDLSVRLISELLDKVPKNIKIITFSSDYAIEPEGVDEMCTHPQSIYALTKCWQEELVNLADATNVRVVRISNLYGKHFPENTFPGKVMKRYARGERNFCIPKNECLPTSTGALGVMLAENLDRMFDFPSKIVQLAPSGITTYAKWARIFLPKDALIEETIDLERPMISRLGSFVPWGESWETLWRREGI